MYLIRSGAFAGLGRLIRRLGGNPITLAKEAGLSPSQFRNPNSFISYAKVAELLERVSATCNESFVGLLLAPRQDMGIFRDLMASICQEPTVSDAIKKMNQYLYLHASGIHITQNPIAEDIQIEVNFDFSTPLGTDQLAQFSVGRLIQLIDTLMDGDPYRFGIYLRQAPPAKNAIPNRAPFSLIHYSATFDGMRIPARALLQEPNVDKDALQVHFSEYLRFLKEHYPDNLQNQVKELIGRLLPSGDCSIDKVASSLNLHPRNLQRKLQGENTNYASLLKETRQTIAEQYLSHGRIPITDLALNLGYAEISVFSRHFKAWTGCSPTEWQRKIQQS